MNGHYFKNDPNLKHDLKEISLDFSGIKYRFYTDSGVFSKDKVDEGSLILLKNITLKGNEKSLLDLGSGYGPIGIILKKIYPFLNVDQSEINKRALELSIKNSELNQVKTTPVLSDGFKEINKSYDLITLNPPIRAGKEIIYKLYRDAYKHLNDFGTFFIVVRKQQGALSHIKELKSYFLDVDIVKKSKGYYVIKCEKQKNT